jgi:heat-inducible transcriptional repressor
MVLTPRQELILRKVVERYHSAGMPIGSKALAADPELDCGPSTVRNELALLEEHGLLAHPHTSAGRVPTDAGHRYVVDSLLRRELDDAMRVTTETLSEVTNLLAIVSAPSVESATIRRVEVLTLQPNVVMVVVITATGGVSKYVCSFDAAVDPGLVAWAGEYFNERLGGLALGARLVGQRLSDPSVGPREQAFIGRLAPAFSAPTAAAADALYVEGTSRLLGAHQFSDVSELNELMELLEQRVALLEILRRVLGERGVYVRIGRENELPALRSLSLVASGYGLARRNLGTVSVIGPVHMDYEVAITTVRAAAFQLSRFVEDVYDET